MTRTELIELQTYEYVPQSAPGYKAARLIWLDIDGCGSGEVPAQEGHYELKSPVWRSTISGRLLTTTGHTHDGGDIVRTYINGQVVCKSQQLYGTRPGFVEKKGVANLSGAGNSHSHSSAPSSDTSMLHISDTETCLDFGHLKKDDIIQVGATYNTTAHALNLNEQSHSHGSEAGAPPAKYA